MRVKNGHQPWCPWASNAGETQAKVTATSERPDNWMKQYSNVKESLVPSSFPHSFNLRKDLLNISSHFMRLDDQGGFESQGKNMSVCPLSPDQPIILSSRKAFFDVPLLNSKAVRT